MLFLKLFFSFFKIGFFSLGGNGSILAILQNEMVYDQEWMSSAEFTNMLALSQTTPGPVCVNAATFCGYSVVHNAGMGEWMSILGSLTAILALILPSFIIVIMICSLFMRRMKSPVVTSIMKGLRPAVVGVFAATALLLINSDNFASFNTSPWHFGVSVFIFAATLIGTRVMHISPIRMLCWAAFAGLMLLY